MTYEYNYIFKFYPNDKPKETGKYLVYFRYIDDLGEGIFSWFAWWDGEKFNDFSGCNDVKKGYQIIAFAEDISWDKLCSKNKS